MVLRKSAEDYLETILILQKKKGIVHSIDVAHHLDFSKPSVSRAVSNLRNDGYLIMHENGELELTEAGRIAAENTYERHTILTSLFTSLGVDEKVAAEDACNVEHAISAETFAQLKKAYCQSIESGKDGVLPVFSAKKNK